MSTGSGGYGGITFGGPQVPPTNLGGPNIPSEAYLQNYYNALGLAQTAQMQQQMGVQNPWVVISGNAAR